tara:strand:+ start:237 stop:767 length:531 start_codon:yes stop_codon:yes gene_type:complete
MHLVVGIDVGIKNQGLCVFDFSSAKVVFWDNVSLVPNGSYVPMNNVKYVREFVQRHQHFFDNAAFVIIERQIRCNMRIVEAVLHTMFYEKVHLIHARSIKAHYNLGTKNYRMNKQRAVQWAEQFVQNNPNAFALDALQPFTLQKKRDDLADSLLLIMYYLDTYSNQLEQESSDVGL